MAEVPAVPLTLEGSYALHQMFRFGARNGVSCRRRAKTRSAPAVELLTRLEAGSTEAGATHGHPNQSALYSQIGHKGDMLLLHFRDTLEDVHRAELSLAALEMSEFLDTTHSYFQLLSWDCTNRARKLTDR